VRSRRSRLKFCRLDSGTPAANSTAVTIMKIAARGIVASLSYFVILALVLLATASSAQAPQKSLKDQLVGHWQLVAVTMRGRTPYGANPQGSMILDPSGHYSVVVISGGKAKDISYFGTYAVNDADRSVTMHVDASAGGGVDVVGHEVKRLVTLDGDQLIMANQTSSGAPGGIKVTWKRAN
jgi:hypothetical protein